MVSFRPVNLESEDMPKEYINPPSLFRSQDVGFSQAVAASGSRTLYLSGQTAWDANRQLIGGADLALQATQAFRNIKAIVEAAGGSMSDVVSLRIYIVNYASEKANVVTSALREAFRSHDKPATTWIGVAALADAGFLIEIEATAVLD